MSKIRDTAIVGIGHTEYSKASGRSELQLAAEASIAAIHDAGLTPADIDGAVTFQLDSSDEMDLMRSLGGRALHWTARAPFGGAGATSSVQMAAAAIASGAAKAVLIYRAFNERSGFRFGQPDGGGMGWAPKVPNFHYMYGLDTPAKIYALWYHRYMLQYGVTNEDFGRYVVTARKHAATNPRAWFYKRPITLEDHQASRWIVEPVLRLLDCCQESDGGVALVMTSAERVKDSPNGGARLLAATQTNLTDTDVMFNYYAKDPTRLEDAQITAARLYSDSGLRPSDIDVAMIYENFSPLVFMNLESHGFCKPGEASDFIRDGNIELTGSLPVNTNGGLLGEGYIHGMNNIVEGVRQIRGSAVNQIKGAEAVLVSGNRTGLILGRL